MLSSGFNMSNVVKRPELKEKFVETSKDLFKVYNCKKKKREGILKKSIKDVLGFHTLYNI